jgi:phosphoglycolate phosphatase-like HAD superfamily hydrolase
MVQAVIWDFHGTLADTSRIVHLAHERRYDDFYEASLSCPPIVPVVRAAQWSAQHELANLLLTGMPERYRDGLVEWLARYEVPVSMALMREPEDRYKKDFIVKRRMYDHVVGLGYYVVRAWEDSPGVIDLWKALGIDVVEMPRHEPVGEVDIKLSAS